MAVYYLAAPRVQALSFPRRGADSEDCLCLMSSARTFCEGGFPAASSSHERRGRVAQDCRVCQLARLGETQIINVDGRFFSRCAAPAKHAENTAVVLQCCSSRTSASCVCACHVSRRALRIAHGPVSVIPHPSKWSCARLRLHLRPSAMTAAPAFPISFKLKDKSICSTAQSRFYGSFCGGIPNTPRVHACSERVHAAVLLTSASEVLSAAAMAVAPSSRIKLAFSDSFRSTGLSCNPNSPSCGADVGPRSQSVVVVHDGFNSTLIPSGRVPAGHGIPHGTVSRAARYPTRHSPHQLAMRSHA